MEELFSAARTEFRSLQQFCFHNCLYDGVWRDSRRRWDTQVPTTEVLRTYGRDYKCIFVGDASMSPYEITHPGGAAEHWNPEPGRLWLERARMQWPDTLWINPVPEAHWSMTPSIGLVRDAIGGAMVPLSLAGLTRGMRLLAG